VTPLAPATTSTRCANSSASTGSTCSRTSPTGTDDNWAAIVPSTDSRNATAHARHAARRRNVAAAADNTRDATRTTSASADVPVTAPAGELPSPGATLVISCSGVR
jgi:hypothetical protein